MTTKVNFETLPDGSHIITVQGKNNLGQNYIRQDRIESPAVWEALKERTYTAEDMEAFAEWTAFMQWIYDHTDKCWFQKHSSETITTAQLRELWEQERREK